ncbi:D-alanyl-D-alanine carboxypeptidase [Streptomyces sp. NBC_01435]|uniref:D-alanyl-D-alanine carboxypeptidase n=1 Tax=Streptomyces sp. NBC_01435 TaxID=2903865 RepID=UPI002E35DD92|nr:D-alanyl-D-alanine carboxypeptidase [Streptomyces sp. NBC_01435]
MAGESPDKSEQQKSSGTARSESDPRLAVFREPPADDAADTKTDTATAVFRTAPATTDDEGTRTDTATAVFRTMPSGDGEGGEGGDDARPSAESEGSGGAVSAAEAAETEGAGKGSERPEKAPGAAESADAPDAVDAAADEEEPAEPAGPAEAAEGAGDGTGEGDARLRAAVAAWVSKDDDADGDDAADDAKSDDAEKAADADEDAEKAADAAKDTDKPSEDEPSGDKASSDEKKAEKADEAKAAAGESEEAKAKEAKSEKAKSEEADDDAADEAGDAVDDDKQGIDQPTAIFRAPAARVDQPTTALKITPPASKSKPESTSKSKAESAPESAAERTSKFVPLRSDDVRPASAPAPRKPETPAAPAASAPLYTAERTTQQPMPPRPPLDLLAELTNTPPPPETPVRTAVRRVKIWTPLALLLLIVFAIVQTVRPLPDPELQMSAKPTYTFEGSKPSLPWPNEGQAYMAATGLGPVGSFGEQKAVPIGSVAKAMTAYIVLKDHPLKKGEEGPSIKVDATAEKEGGYDAVNESTLNTVKEGDKLTLKQALSAIMIPSANNIARLLARWDAGSEEAFVKKMNDTAKSLGMKNTTYTDPSGLNATTVSSAEDQVKLGEKLVEIPALMAITVLPSWTDPSGHEWPNWNKLVPFNGSLGIKTGSTTKAGGNLLFAAHKMVGKTDQLIVGAVLGQHKDPIIDTANAVSKDVMIATQDLLKDAKVIKKGDVVGSVSDGLGGSTPVVATKDVTVVGWSGLTVKIELTDGGKTIPHSAKAGTPVGTLTVGEGTSQVKVPVALQSDLVEPAFGDKLTRIG